MCSMLKGTKLYVLLLCLCLAFVGKAKADETAAVRLLNASGGGTVHMTVKNISDNQPTPGGLITWSNIQAGNTIWKVADQYIEISKSNLPESWGLQIYTDNKNNSASPKYTGTSDPAGLIKTTNTILSLPMAWRITDSILSQNELIDIRERTDNKGFNDYSWRYLKDKNTPDNPATAEDEAFVNGEDYVTVWNQSGIAWGESGRSKNPQKAYIYLSAKFAIANVNSEYKTSMLTLEAYHGISVFPFYLFKDGAPAAQMAYGFLNAKMDKYFSANEKRAIESYSNPFPPGPDGNLEKIAFTYDNALAICAYLARPTENNLKRAKLLCDSLIWAQDNDTFADGRVRDAYDASKEFSGLLPLTSGNFFRASTTGNIAWFINALAQYYKNSNDTDTTFLDKVLDAAKSAGEFIHSNFYHASQPGYYYGHNTDGTLNSSKSTEHNIATYVAFSHLYDMTGEAKWLTRANNAKNFIDNIAWQAGGKRYICGLDSNGNPNNDTLVADTTLLAVLAFGNFARNNNAIDYVVNHFRYNDTIRHLEGIDFGYNVHNSSSEPDGIWFEGTAQLAAAYKVAGFYGETDDSQRYLESIKRAQYDALNADYKSIVAASKDDLTTGLGWSYYASPHVAATAWFAVCNMNYNILWGTSLNSAIPSPGDNRSFSQAPSLLVDNNSYLENHYMPSGIMNYIPGLVAIDSRFRDNPHSGDTCLKISWNGKAGADGWKWGGVVWQEPENEWIGGQGKGYDLRGADYLSFWARTDSLSSHPGKSLKIKAYFGYSGDSSGETPPIWRDELTTQWKQYIIMVLDHDMSHVSNGFTVVFNDENTPQVDGCNIYLDDIEYKKW